MDPDNKIPEGAYLGAISNQTGFTAFRVGDMPITRGHATTEARDSFLHTVATFNPASGRVHLHLVLENKEGSRTVLGTLMVELPEQPAQTPARRRGAPGIPPPSDDSDDEVPGTPPHPGSPRAPKRARTNSKENRGHDSHTKRRLEFPDA